MADNLELRASKESKYRTLATLFGILALIFLIGWLSAAKKPIDADSLSARLAECESVDNISENETCAQAVEEMRILLTEYQNVLSDIPASVLQGATSTTPTTPVVSTTTLQIQR